jgi:hypothetical protein
MGERYRVLCNTVGPVTEGDRPHIPVSAFLSLLEARSRESLPG